MAHEPRPPTDSTVNKNGGKGLKAGFLCAAMVLAAMLPTAPFAPPPLHTPAAYALSEEQELVDEAWRVTNLAYVDRTFHGQDWRAVRLNAVKRQYRNKAEAYAAIRTMLGSLDDKFTRFLTPDEYENLAGLARGDVAGIGVELTPGGGGTGSGGSGSRGGGPAIVADVVPGSPAARAGLQSGDALVSIDGEPTDGIALDAVAGMLRGPIGSSVRVDTAPAAAAGSGGGGGGPARALKLIREEIKLVGVLSRLETLPDGKRAFVITVKSFSKDTAADVRSALEGLRKTGGSRGGSGADAIFLDLRHDPGGFFPGGIDTARLFLPADRTIVTVVDRNGIGD
ncbi:unnamed protein product, partial [Phaeothamnion confervicola]